MKLDTSWKNNTCNCINMCSNCPGQVNSWHLFGAPKDRVKKTINYFIPTLWATMFCICTLQEQQCFMWRTLRTCSSPSCGDSPASPAWPQPPASCANPRTCCSQLTAEISSSSARDCSCPYQNQYFNASPSSHHHRRFMGGWGDEVM